MNEIILTQNDVVPTQALVVEQVDKIVTAVDNGEIDALKVIGNLTALEKVAATAKKAIMPYAVNQAERWGEKSFTTFGAKFEVAEAGVKYDYSEDEKWQKLIAKKEELDAKIKAREVELKKLGRCSKTSTTIVKVSLAK